MELGWYLQNDCREGSLSASCLTRLSLCYGRRKVVGFGIPLQHYYYYSGMIRSQVAAEPLSRRTALRGEPLVVQISYVQCCFNTRLHYNRATINCGPATARLLHQVRRRVLGRHETESSQLVGCSSANSANEDFRDARARLSPPYFLPFF